MLFQRCKPFWLTSTSHSLLSALITSKMVYTNTIGISSEHGQSRRLSFQKKKENEPIIFKRRSGLIYEPLRYSAADEFRFIVVVHISAIPFSSTRCRTSDVRERKMNTKRTRKTSATTRIRDRKTFFFFSKHSNFIVIRTMQLLSVFKNYAIFYNI